MQILLFLPELCITIFFLQVTRPLLSTLPIQSDEKDPEIQKPQKVQKSKEQKEADENPDCRG
jgi:hypothetical protein